MKLLQRPFVKKSILVVGIAVGLYVVFTFLVPLVIPFLIAFLLAALMQPLIGILENKLHLTHKAAFGITTFLFTIGFVILGIFILNLAISRAQSFLMEYPFYQAKFMDGLCGCCDRIDGWLRLGQGASYAYITTLLEGILATFTDTVLPKLTTGSVKVVQMFFHGVVFFFVTAIATILLTNRYQDMREKLQEGHAGKLICRCGHHLYLALTAYGRAQVVIMFVNMCILSVVLYLIDTPYFVLIAALISVLDALPFIGAGLILIPWGLALAFMGMSAQALYVAVGYFITSCVREVLEPKLVGDKIGISTLTSLVCMYVGLKLFGILGFLFGPIAFLIGKELFEAVWEEMIREG